MSDRNKKGSPARLVDGVMKKLCRICGKEKPLDEFPKDYYKHKRGPSVGDGHRHDCTKCHSKHARKNTLERTTPEQRRAYMKAWRIKNNLKKTSENLEV